MNKRLFQCSMKKFYEVRIGIIVALFSVLTQAQAAPLLYENWESGIDSNIWVSWGSPQPFVYTGATAWETGSMDPNGDQSWASGVTALQPITIEPGLKISYKLNLLADGGGAATYNHLRVTLTTTDPSNFGGDEPPIDFSFIDNLHQAENEQNHNLRIDTTGAATRYTMPASGDYGQWVDWSVEIDAAGYVHYYRNGSLLASSTTAFAADKWGQDYYLVVMGRSYNRTVLVDEISVEVMTPKYVVFDTNRNGNYEIYRMDEDGSNPVNLTNDPGNDYMPSASPDGARVLFSTDRNGNQDIYSMDFYGGDVVQLTNHPFDDLLPEYSPDGSKIAYTRADPSNANVVDIYVMNADGTNVQPLATTSDREEEPRWSPDGSKIMYSRLTGSGWQVFVMNPDGSSQTQLTFSGANRYHAWSPDGTQILYDRTLGGGIYRADIDPTYSVLSNDVLITDTNDKGAPSWTPSSKILYQYTYNGGNTSDIYSVNSDGTNATLLTSSGTRNNFARWLCAAFAEVSLPDTAIAYNQSISLPVSISNVDTSVVSAELFVTFDSALLTYNSVVTTGALAAGWTIESNVAAGAGGIDTLKIAAATDNSAISTDGTLLYVDFQVADVRQPNNSALDIVHALLNDGSQEVLANDGSITIVGNDAQGSTDVATIIPRETITVTIIDADEDLDGVASTDQVTVSVANGAQTETLTLNETATPGEFSGSISTVFALGSTSAANSGDNTVQAKAGDQIVFTFVDQLLGDGSGPANLNLLVNVIGGTDGSVEITQAMQPGDIAYVKVTDADLNTDSGVQETAQVVVTSSGGDSETVTLTELDADDEVFFGTLSSGVIALVVEDGIVSIARPETLVATYDDVVTALGDQVDRTDTTQVIDPWGDADGNGLVQAFDAALILQDVLNPPVIIGLEALQADVGDPFGSRTPYDASLVLQKRVGLISAFPVQQAASLNHPQPTPSSPKQIADTRSLRLVAGEGYISVMADERAQIVAGDVLLEGINGQVQLPEELGDFLVASRATDEGLRVVFAGAEGVEGPGELLRVYGVGPDGASLVRASFNDGSIVAWMDAGPVQNTPATYALHANTPNPFNPETVIAFDLPQGSVVHLDIYDALGQKVRTLVSNALAAGAHRFAWDGRDARGSQVSSGVYFYRLQAGEYVQTRRMLLLK